MRSTPHPRHPRHPRHARRPAHALDVMRPGQAFGTLGDASSQDARRWLRAVFLTVVGALTVLVLLGTTG